MVARVYNVHVHVHTMYIHVYTRMQQLREPSQVGIEIDTHTTLNHNHHQVFTSPALAMMSVVLWT